MSSGHYIVFKIEEKLYGISISSVDKVIRAVELTSIPTGTEIILGLIHIRKKAIPVFNIRRRMRIPDKDIRIDDRIIIAKTDAMQMAFIVDEIEGVVEFAINDFNNSSDIHPEMSGLIRGICKYKERPVIIYDIGQLFPAAYIRDMLGLNEQN